MPTEQEKLLDRKPPGTSPGLINQPTEPTIVVDLAEDNVVVDTEPPDDHEDKVHKVRHDDFKKIKDAAKAKGRAEALAEQEAAAKAAGFDSFADALKAAADFKTKPVIVAKPPATLKTEPQAQETEPAMPTNPPARNARDAAKAAQETNRLTEERSRLRKQWRSEERRRRDLQRMLDAKDAEMGLREEMYGFGVTDVDYGLRLLTRQLEGKTEEEIAAFDREAFFKGVRTEKPYLFGEKVVAATTGTNGTDAAGDSPNAPAPGAASVDVAKGQQFNAREAKPGDVQARLRALGLNPHHT